MTPARSTHGVMPAGLEAKGDVPVDPEVKAMLDRWKAQLAAGQPIRVKP